jgi:ATP-dependent DNA ligase
VYEIVLRFIPPRGRADRTETMNPNWLLSTHTDHDGAAIFQQACKMGLEGIVSKRLSAPYRSGPSRDWIKVKNPDSPAMIRPREAEWSNGKTR